MKPSLKKLRNAGVVCLSLFVTAACGANDTPHDADGKGAAAEAETGSLSLALTTSVGDHQYRFSSFTVLIWPDYTWLQSNGGSESVLTAQLPTGHHQADLYNWELERDDGTGNFRHVDATLLSSYYVDFEILNGSTTTVTYQFETDGEIVTMGAGTLNVAGHVEERPPVCTVLGDDCGEGLWCPPTGITGAPLACRAAGAVEIGASCASPAECVANSSCIDLGAGPVCAELCAPDSFDQACVSGGQCVAVGADYGVCTP